MSVKMKVLSSWPWISGSLARTSSHGRRSRSTGGIWSFRCAFWCASSNFFSSCSSVRNSYLGTFRRVWTGA
uniref:Putative secreted protein n=1 Tax=Ixodes ricinus TaxID=34613 RepID=A0A6B0U1V0_IXORI